MKKFINKLCKNGPKSADHFCPPNSHMQTFSTNTKNFFNFIHDDDNQQYANVISITLNVKVPHIVLFDFIATTTPFLSIEN